MSRINFAVAGSFMFTNFLTSIEDDEVEYWSNEVKHYRRLLEMHSFSFDTTKLAATRMELFASANKAFDKHGDGPVVLDREVFLRDMQ